MANANTLPVKATLLLISTLTVMSGATISPSLTAMRESFVTVPGVDYLVRLTLTLPALFIAFGAPFVGIIIDRLGRKPLLVCVLLLYALAGSSGFVLNRLGLILVGRAILGISVAGIMTTATTLIADYYEGSTRAQFLGLQAGFMGLGGVLFLTVGGLLADLSWRFPFLIYLFALLLVPCALFLLPEPQLSFQKNKIQDNLAQELQPLPVTLVVLTYGIAVLTQIAFYLIPVQLPFYLKELFGAKPTQVGLAIAFCTLISAVASLNYRQVKARLSFIAIYGIAFLNMALGYLLISLGSSIVIVLLGLAVAGAGLGLLMPNMTLCLVSISPEALRGRVLGGITTAFFLGQFLSPLFSQPLGEAIGLGHTYGVAGGVMVLMAIAAAITLRFWR